MPSPTNIRPDIRAALDRYAEHGLPVGDFLQAVLANDLMDAIGRADDYNRATLYDICCYVHNDMPSACHGSRQAYREWVAAKFGDPNRTAEAHIGPDDEGRQGE